MKKLLAFSAFFLIPLCAGPVAAAGTPATSSLLAPNRIEEAFVDSLGVCGAGSVTADTVGKTNDPGVRRALRNAMIVEAADDAAGLGGGAKTHSDCMQKHLSARGITAAEMAVMPDCVEHDWPEPLYNLGDCVVNRARLVSKTAAQ